MKRCWIVPLVLVAAVACGGSTAPDDTTNPPPPPPTKTNTPGTTNRTVTVDGSQREFVVHVGSTSPTTTAVPVVIMLHGTTGTGPLFFNISGWREKADQEGFIAVFPSALEYCFYEDENKDGDFNDADERKIATKWTHGDLGNPTAMPLCTAQVIATLPAATRTSVDHPFREDVPFMDAVLTFLKANYVVDEKRIYVSGFSNGAQFANRLAVERSNVFAATHAHAGGTSVPTPGGRAMSVAVSVGSLDDRYTIPLGVTEFPVTEDALTTGLGFIFVVPLITQLNLKALYTYDELTIAGKKVGRWVFNTGVSGPTTSSVTFLLFDDNYHTYPNGTSYPVTFANVLWEFFKTQRLP